MSLDTMHKLSILLGCVALVACTDTYHPEYHPVTVTTVQQATGGPVITAPNESYVAPPPVLVSPAQTGRPRS